MPLSTACTAEQGAYRLEVWKYGTIVDCKTTNVLSWLQNYYDQHWKWAEADGDCYCELFVNGQKLDVEETDKYLEGRFDY